MTDNPSPAEWRALWNQTLTQVLETVKEVKGLIKEESAKTDARYNLLSKEITEVREKVLRFDAANYKDAIEEVRKTHHMTTNEMRKTHHDAIEDLRKTQADTEKSLHGENGLSTRITKIETKSLVWYSVATMIINFILAVAISWVTLFLNNGN
jgi:vacuolar-type H+-ATPase subunit I/STV1